jgi:hypothetical protein
MNERDEVRTADLADGRPGDTAGPDPIDHEAGPETRDDPVRDSSARDKLAQGPAATVHREDTTGWGGDPAREQDRPEVTSPRTPTAPDGDAAVGATAGPLLAADDAEAFRARWTDVQNGFVDAPRQAVERADGLTAALMQHLAGSFADERGRLERQWDRGDEVSTDSLRSAFQRYRSFFERLLAT